MSNQPDGNLILTRVEGGIPPPSKQDVMELIQACDIRYFEHLATSNAYKDSLFQGRIQTGFRASVTFQTQK